jgi:predicted amidohydrolase
MKVAAIQMVSGADRDANGARARRTCGQALGVQADGEAVVVAELDAALLQQDRQRLPALVHRVL